jgi:hypothetical protein
MSATNLLSKSEKAAQAIVANNITGNAKMYQKYRSILGRKAKIDQDIADAIAAKEHKVSYQCQYTDDTKVLFCTPQYGNSKSILEELKEMYPAPFKVKARETSCDWTKRHGEYYYSLKWLITIKWDLKKLKKAKKEVAAV